MIRSIPLAVALLCLSLTALAEEPDPGEQVFLPRKVIGADRFLAKHPTYDGRGVVVAVLDGGIDPGHPGFRELPDGRKKLVGWFAVTGDEGRVELRDGSPEGKGDQRVLALPGGGWAQLGGVTAERWRVGVLSTADLGESRLAGVDSSDPRKLRGKPATRRAVALGRRGKAWLCWIDTDADGRLDDEQPLADINAGGSCVELGRSKAIHLVVRISPDGSWVKVGQVASGHGSHCAGIIAGRKLGEGRGFDGVAPGARLLSIKIGDARIGHWATDTSTLEAYMMSALRGADVVNYSYGGRTAWLDGRHLTERLVDRLTEKYGTVFCISAGNDGPGIASVGSPSQARRAYSVAALLPRQTARANHGYLGWPGRPFGFSSRGPTEDGRLKPDIAAPGSALSATTLWSAGHANMWGTSMAAPHLAGAVALLISGAKQEKLWFEPGASSTEKFRCWQLLRRAILMSAAPVEGAGPLDVGAGMVQVDRAFEAYRRLATQHKAGRKLDVEYKVRVATPGNRSGADGAGAVIRFGTPARQRLHFSVSPELRGISARKRKSFLRGYVLRSSADWLLVGRATGGERDEPIAGRGHVAIASWGAQIDLELRPQGLAPGIHMAMVAAYPQRAEFLGAWGASDPWPSFRLPVVVVVPRRLDARGTGSWPIQLAPGGVERVFVHAPEGSSSLTATLATAGRGRVGIRCYDPRGEGLAGGEASTTQPAVIRQQLPGEAGTYELVLRAHREMAGPVTAQLTVRRRALVVGPADPDAAPVTLEGGKASWRLRFRNAGPAAGRLSVAGELQGRWHRAEVTLKKGGLWRHPLFVPSGIKKLIINGTVLGPAVAGRYYPAEITLRGPDGRKRRWDDLFSGTELDLDNPAPGRWELVGRYAPERSRAAFGALGIKQPPHVRARVEVRLERASAIPLAAKPDALSLSGGERREATLAVQLEGSAAYDLGESGWYGRVTLSDRGGAVLERPLLVRHGARPTAGRALAQAAAAVWTAVVRRERALHDAARLPASQTTTALRVTAGAQAAAAIQDVDRAVLLQRLAEGADGFDAEGARALLAFLRRHSVLDAGQRAKIEWMRGQDKDLAKATASLGALPWGLDPGLPPLDAQLMQRQLAALGRKQLAAAWRAALRRRNAFARERGAASAHAAGLRGLGIPAAAALAMRRQLDDRYKAELAAWAKRAPTTTLSQLIGELAAPRCEGAAEAERWRAWLAQRGLSTDGVELIARKQGGVLLLPLALPDRKGKGGRVAVLFGPEAPRWRVAEALLEAMVIGRAAAARLAERLPADPVLRRGIARGLLRHLTSHRVAGQPAAPADASVPFARLLWLRALDSFARDLYETPPRQAPSQVWATVCKAQLGLPKAPTGLPAGAWLLEDPAAPMRELLVEAVAVKVQQALDKTPADQRAARIESLLAIGNRAPWLSPLQGWLTP